MFSGISSKDLIDKRVLGRCWKEVFLFVFSELRFVGGNVGEDVETEDGSRRDGGTGDNVCGTIWDVEEGIIFRVVKDRPSKFGGWGTRDKGDGRWGSKSVNGGTWEVPSVMVGLKDFKDSGGGVGNVLLIYVIEGGPGSDRDVGKGGGGDDGGLRGSEGHLRQLAPL